jgi:hypothetical protein
MECATQYIHIDCAGDKVAAIGGSSLYIWTILVSKSGDGTKITLSEIPIPRSQVRAISKPPNTMYPRTVHFLTQGDSLIISFVEADITKSSGHL